MPIPHPRPWHAGSLFGDGPRRPLDREQRARFRFLLTSHRRARRLTPLAELVGNTLVRRLSVEGRCDPAHDTIADDVGCASRTVRRALDAMRGLGLVTWQRRIVRDGWRIAQTSNAYLLAPSDVPNPPEFRAPGCGGHSSRGILQDSFNLPAAASQAAVRAAQDALAKRRAEIEARLLGKGLGCSVPAT